MTTVLDFHSRVVTLIVSAEVTKIVNTRARRSWCDPLTGAEHEADAQGGLRSRFIRFRPWADPFERAPGCCPLHHPPHILPTLPPSMR